MPRDHSTAADLLLQGPAERRMSPVVLRHGVQWQAMTGRLAGTTTRDIKAEMSKPETAVP